MSDLTKRLESAVSRRIDHARFDVVSELEKILEPLGLTAEDGGGALTVRGADPVVPSVLRLGGAAAIGLLAKSIAAAAFHRWRGGPGQDIAVDLRSAPHRLSPFYDGKWERIGRYFPRPSLEVGNAFSYMFYRTADARWVFPQANYTSLRLAAQKLLGVPLTYEAVVPAIAGWNGTELEERAAEVGLVMPLVRGVSEMLRERQYREVLAEMPLIEVTKIGESPREPLKPLGAMPFSGYRALGMGHVIAGAGFGRSLALHGADVLNLWRPGEGEHEPIYASANVGLRSAWLDPRQDRAILGELLRGADIFFHNRRPGFMREIGMTAADAARERPGIVYVSVSVHGNAGPWADRPGFDQTAGSVAGVMTLEGTEDAPQLPPIVVVNDYLVAWLAQVGAVAALRRRGEEGGSYHVHVSLTRVALWLISLGVFDKQWMQATAGSSEEHRYFDPETFRARTPMGDYQGITEQITMSETPGFYDPVLVARGSSSLSWR